MGPLRLLCVGWSIVIVQAFLGGQAVLTGTVRQRGVPRGAPLYMIDNFFRLHEKNREMKWDEFYGKARYDLPQAFGTATVTFNEQPSIGDAVRGALKEASRQMPACADLDLAIVSISTPVDGDTAMADVALSELAQQLPGHTAVVGWAGPVGCTAVRPMVEAPGGAQPVEVHGGAITVTLASLPAVTMRRFFVSDEELSAWAKETASRDPPAMAADDSEAPITSHIGSPLQKRWEALAGVTMNQAYKDPPVFFMFGSLTDRVNAQEALFGLDVAYPGTAKVGGISVETADRVTLFSRELMPGRREGSRITKEEGKGLVGMSLCGDIRALVYVLQGAGRVHEGDQRAWRVEALSDDGKKVLKVTDAHAEGAVAVSPAEAGLKEGSALGISSTELQPVSDEQTEAEWQQQLDEGADRWSFVSVRGSRQRAVVMDQGEWSVDPADGGLVLPFRTQVGDHVSLYERDSSVAKKEAEVLLQALKKEIELEWLKPELGVMKFRPSGALLVKGPAYPVLDQVVSELTDIVPNAYIGGLEAPGGQFGSLDPVKESALFSNSLVINLFACKAKRRDAREIRLDSRRPYLERIEVKDGDSLLDLRFAGGQADAETGEPVVNRQVALIGSDMRVDNMAWNVREENVVAAGLLESMVWTKERELQFVRDDAPLLNVMRMVMMQIKNPDPAVQAKSKGVDVYAALAAAAEGGRWVEVGDVMRGSPFDGVVNPTYDPVAMARNVVQQGAAAVSVRVDQTYYGGKYQHVRDIKNELRQLKESESRFNVPVIADDMVLYPYQVYLAKLFGADGVKTGVAVLTDEGLMYQVKVCANLGVTPILSVSSLRQLQRATALLANMTAVVVVDDVDLMTMKRREGGHPAVEWLRDEVVRGNLEAAKSPPVVLVEGRVGGEEERGRLVEVGVKGCLISCADERYQKAAAVRYEQEPELAAAK